MASYYEHDRTVFLSGKLGLSVVELRPNNFAHDFSSKLFNVYSEYVEQTPIGQQILAKLEADPRVSSLKDELISRGSSASRFEVKNLACWYLWRANKVGLDCTNLDLEIFLNSEELTVINSLWVTGIELDEELEIEDGISIRPAQSMPDSHEKEQFLKHFFHSTGLQELKPTCAITKNVSIPKLASKDNSPISLPVDHVFRSSRSRFYDCALLLNVLPNVTCLPYYATGHLEDSTPLGPFGGSSGGGPVYDIPSKITTKITSESVIQLLELLTFFDKLDTTSRVRIQRAIHRLSQAKRRFQLEDQILDLGIAMEMLLLDNKPDQLALSFRLRGSWLLSTTNAEKLGNYQTLKEIYSYRSDVAHTGILCNGDQSKIARVNNSLPKYQRIAEDVCKKIILNGFPNWENLILDID
jgi:Apea-like HEPN